MQSKYLIVFLISCCFLSSCRSLRQESQKVVQEKQINFEKKVTYQDTVIVTPKAETSLKIATKEAINAPPRVFEQKNGQARVKIKIIRDTIFATAICDSIAMAAKIKKELIKEHFSQRQENNKSEKIKPVWSWDFTALVAFTFAIIILPLVFKYLKK